MRHCWPEDTRFTKSAEKPRHSCRGGIGVGRAGLNAQEPNKTHAVPEPSMGEGTAEREAPAFMPGRMSPKVPLLSNLLFPGRTFQCGEGWHSNEHAVRFWHPSPRVPKETAARCYAYTTPYTTMIPLCNVY